MSVVSYSLSILKYLTLNIDYHKRTILKASYCENCLLNSSENSLTPIITSLITIKIISIKTQTLYYQDHTLTKVIFFDKPELFIFAKKLTIKMLNDTFKHRGLRKKLVETVRGKGIKDEAVLKAINNIPRHLFLDSSFLEFAYQDQAFPIGSGQTISQPYTVAFQTELLEIKAGDVVLEVGTGSGYQACVFAEMKAKVLSIERQKKLFHKTKKFLSQFNYRIKLFYGDGYKGLPAFAPFDKIIVTAGAPFVPEELLKQLKIGGRLVIPVDIEKGLQEMTCIMRISEKDYEKRLHGKFRFVPMLGNKASD